MWRAVRGDARGGKGTPSPPCRLFAKKPIDSRVETRYHGATNFKGSRISASCEAGRVTLPWNHGLGIEENHKAAAERLIRKLGWHGKYAIGATQRGYVFVGFYWPTTDIDDSWSVLDTSGVLAHGSGAKYHAAS